MTQLSIMLTAIAAILTAYLIFTLYERHKGISMSRIAKTMGLGFYRDPKINLDEEYKDICFFSKAHFAKIKNLIYGKIKNVHMNIFDYEYKIYPKESESKTKTYQQTVIVFKSPDLKLPDFILRPKHENRKMCISFGYHDVDMSSQPHFTKYFQLKAWDEDSIRHLFSPDVITALSDRKGWSMEGNGHRLVLYRHNKQLDPEKIPDFLQNGLNILHLFQPNNMNN